MNTILERALPANVDAERTIIGAILLDNKAFDECSELQYEDFPLDSHRVIFRTIGKMVSKGVQADTTTLPEFLGRDGQLSSVGGTAYIWSLTENLPRRLALVDYVQIVKDKSRLRQIVFLGEEMGLRKREAFAEHATQQDHLQLYTTLQDLLENREYFHLARNRAGEITPGETDLFAGLGE